MECFNELLLKLREVHEREVEGWQVKVQELSNKKGCDTKRMEELFTRNQQMKEQQRLLTENIKTLENRLRAGLCDRCTVTQEVAKRKQQEFEAAQIQSLQHISLLASEMNNLNKENKRLRDDVRNLRAALDRGPSILSSNRSGGGGGAEVKALSPPDRLRSSTPVALVSAAGSKSSLQPADGDVAAGKCETDQRTEEAESRLLRGPNQSHFELYKSLLLPSGSVASSWKTDHMSARAEERRVPSVEGLDQRSSISPQVLLKNSPSLSGGDVKPTRHVLHAPVPCHPKPIKRSPVPFSWPLSEPPDWVAVTAAASNSAVPPPPPRLSMSRFNNVAPLGFQRQVFSQPWQKPSSSQPPTKEPTVVFRLSNLTDYAESQSKPAEKKKSLQPKAERTSDERLKEACDAPLDLSDPGKSKFSSPEKEHVPLSLQGRAQVHESPDCAVNADSTTPVSSPSPAALSSSSCSPPAIQEPEPASNHNHKVAKEQQEEEVNGKMHQSKEKKVPVLTISLLRPVVVLESLSPALQKQEAPSSNGKSPVEESASSTDEQDESSSGQESSKKKRRASMETEADRDSDSADLQQEKKNKMAKRA